MTPLDPTTAIESWHAHVYFDAPRRDAAWALREVIATALAGRMELGRFHERPVGPHPMWSSSPRWWAGSRSTAQGSMCSCTPTPATRWRTIATVRCGSVARTR
jgi:Dopa 4,5-dioxygenase family